MTSRSILSAAALMAGLGLLAAACLPGAPSAAGPAGQSLTTVRTVQYQSSITSLPVFAAEALGYFREAGLDVQISYAAGGPENLALLLNKSVEFGHPGFEQAILALAENQPIKLAVNVMATPAECLIVSTKKPIPTGKYPELVRELAGSTFAVTSQGASQDYHTRLVLREAGLQPDRDAPILGVGAVPNQIAALDANRVQAILAFEPTIAQLERDGKARCILDLRKGEGPAIMKQWAFSQIAVRSDYLESNRKTVEAFVSAMDRANATLNGYAQVSQVVEAVGPKYYQGLAPEVLEAAVRNQVGSWGSTTSRTAWDNVNRMLMDFGVLKQPVAYETGVAIGLMPGTR